MSESGSDGRPTRTVWDPLVRVGHWLLALSIAAAWITRHGGGAWHEMIGYVSLAIVGVRFVWGWCGSPHARFADFVSGPHRTLGYAVETLRGTEPRVLGHNPLGAWMIVALLFTVVLVGFSGWLYTTDRYWGVEWVENVHSTLADVLLILVAIHVTGVLYASWRHRENLIGAMLHGRKRASNGAPE